MSSTSEGLTRIDETLALENVSLVAEGERILSSLSIELCPGRAYAVVGDHGSGKTSLGRVLSGAYRPTSGRIVVGSKEYRYMGRKAIRQHGIDMLDQEVYLLDEFTIAENLLIPQAVDLPFPYFNRKRLYEQTEKVLRQFGLSFDPRGPLRELSPSEKAMIYIVRALLKDPRYLIMDDTLEDLSTQHTEQILSILERYKKNGLCILYLTHRIDEIYGLADSVSILRNGEIILTDSVDNIDRINLIRLCYSQVDKDLEVQNFSEEFYKLLRYNEAILQKLPTNLIVTDNEFRIKLVNEMGLRYFDANQVGYRDLPLSRLLGDNNSAVLRLIQESLADQQEHVFYNIELDLPRGRSVTNIRLLPIFDGKTRIGSIVSLEDITEQEKLRDHVLLSEKLASVGLLAAGVAHEINNPLEIMYNYLNYLRLAPETEDINRTVSQLESEIETIKQIVSNLISFSDHQKQALDFFNANEMLLDMIDLLKYHARERNVAVEFDSDREGINLYANKNEIKQVVLNLLKNSFEVLPNGGHITIETREIAEGIQILVGDDGPGIEESARQDIFLPFYSTKKASANSDNLGLGLSVTYGIVKKHGGTITVRNRPEGGCVFEIVFPYTTTAAPE